MGPSISISSPALATAATEAATVCQRLVGWVMAAYVRWIVWRIKRYDAAALQAMSDRLLRDIGVTRNEVGGVTRFDHLGD